MRILIAVGNIEEMERVFQSLRSKVSNYMLQSVQTAYKSQRRIVLRNDTEFRISCFDEDFYRAHTCGVTVDYLYYDEVVNRNDDLVRELSIITYHAEDHAVSSRPVCRMKYMPTIDVGEVTRGILWI